MYLPNGAWYEGPWENDAMHGENGKYCFENVRPNFGLVDVRAMFTKVLFDEIPLRGMGNLFILIVTFTKACGKTV
jgi:hypothetical protein